MGLTYRTRPPSSSNGSVKQPQSEQSSIQFGYHAEKPDLPISVPLETFTRTSTHITGISGTGKTTLIRYIQQHLYCLSIPFLNIDIEGPLHRANLAYLANHLDVARSNRIIEMNFSDPPDGMLVGFNPLHRSRASPQLSVQVEFLLQAISYIWKEESRTTPRLRRILRNTIWPLIEAGLSMMEIVYLITLGQSEVRQHLARTCTNLRIRRELLDFDRKNPTRQEEFLESSWNRLADFLDSEMLSLVLGRTTSPINMEDIVGRQTLLVNLSAEGGWLSDDSQALFASLLIATLVAFALTRSEEEGKAAPYFVFCDEFPAYISPSIAVALDRCRKRGVFFILGNQHLHQILQQDEWLFHSVLQNCRVRAVFASDDPFDLATFEPILFANQRDLKTVKHQNFSGSEMHPQFYSLQELQQENQLKIAEQPRGHLLLKVESDIVLPVRVPQLDDDVCTDEQLQALRQIFRETNPHLYQSKELTRQQIEARQKALEEPSMTEEKLSDFRN